MDGCAVARALRASREMQDLYLVALTGVGSEEDRHLCLEAGFDVHLTKPIDFPELQRLLATRCPRPHAPTAAPAQQDQQTA
jgi:CheY-like chemotaxis protein